LDPLLVEKHPWDTTLQKQSKMNFEGDADKKTA